MKLLTLAIIVGVLIFLVHSYTDINVWQETQELVEEEIIPYLQGISYGKPTFNCMSDNDCLVFNESSTCDLESGECLKN